jgi:hypothetical protein
VTWVPVLTDRVGNPLGELHDIDGRTLRRSLSRPATSAWTMRATHPLARYCLDCDLTRVKWYERLGGIDSLRFHGPIASYEKTRDANGGSLALTAADPFAVTLPKRLLGVGAQGASYATALAPEPRGDIAAAMLADANARGDTGLRIGTVEPTPDGYAGPYFFAPADQAISDLSTGFGVFDWWVQPTEATPDALGVGIGLLNIYTAKGATLDDVVFEFGTGKKNVESWRDVGDATGNANRVYGLPPGYPDNATQAVVSQQDAASIDERGLYEVAISTDFQVDALRQSLVDEHVAVRKRPRRVITFQPVAQDPDDTPLADRRVPRAFTDYDIGDVVHFRAREAFPQIDPSTGQVLGMVAVTTVDDLFRVFVIDLSIDASGQAKATVTLVQEA